MSKGFYQGVSTDVNTFQNFTFGETDFKGVGIKYSLLRWWRQFTTLTMKNALVFLRRPYHLAAALIIPGLLVLVTILGNHPVKQDSGATSTPSFTLQQTPSQLQGLGRCDTFHGNCIQVAFSPNVYPFSQIMNNVAELNDLEIGGDVIGFDNNDEHKLFVAANLGTVQFSVFFPNTSLWNVAFDFPDSNSSYVIFYNNSRSSHDPRSHYHNVNFPLLTLQKSIEHSMMLYLNGSTDLSSVVYDASYAQTWGFADPTPFENNNNYYYYNNYNSGGDDSLQGNLTCTETAVKDFTVVGAASPYVFCFGFQLVAVLSYQLLIDERQKGLLKSLRRLGLMDSAYWISLLFCYQVIAFFSTIFALIIAAIIEPTTFVIQHLDYGVLFLFIWLSLTCAYCNAFFLSTVSTSGVIATTIVFFNFVMCLLTLLFIGLPLNTFDEIIPVYGDDYAHEAIAKACGMVASGYNSVYDNRPSIGFAEFVLFWMPWYHTGKVMSDILFKIEYGLDYAYADLSEKMTMYDYLDFGYEGFVVKSTGNALGFMVLSSFIYMLVTWFFSQWMDGIPLEVIMIPMWLRRSMHGVDDARVVEGDVRGMERLASQRDGSIRAYKVSKTYKGVQALKEVTFSINTGEVFTLLGHNGAGKSTLFNILSGVTTTTHGKVYVAGLDVDYEMTELQQHIGVCPQDDYLWDELTALEHMRIHAQFKGIRAGPQLDAACLNVLTLVKLGDRANTLAKDFSGGMKRRLSAAMSIVGSVKVLYLDEPTTGLDPLSRRAIWDMVSLVKKDRVVVLTTHNLEEADFLGDRVMILQTGQVKALGDPLFLKQTYGSGYQVRVTVDSRIAVPVSQDMLKFLPRSAISGEVSAGSIVVQVNKADFDNLSRFLAWLERNQEKSEAIKEWMISNTSLEQVFLKLVESSTVNYVNEEQVAIKENLCPLCQKQSRSPVVVLALRGTHNLLLPDAICENCTAINHYLLSDEETAPLMAPPPDAPQNVKDDHARVMARALQQRRAIAWNKEPLVLSNSYGQDNPVGEANNTNIEEVENRNYGIKYAEVSELGVDTGNQLESNANNVANSIAPVRIMLPNENSRLPKSLRRRGAQVNALMMKNVTLQCYQRCSTCCALFFVLLMFGALYIIGMLFVPEPTCPQGYVSYRSCALPSLSKQLFYDVTLQYGGGTYNAKDVDFGFAISYYLVPNYFYYGGIYLQGTFDGSDYLYASLGLTMASPSFRIATVWSPFANFTAEEYLNGGTLLYYPIQDVTDASDLNAYMFENQQSVYESQVSGAYPECPLFAPSVYSDNRSYDDSCDLYGSMFADAIFSCSDCSLSQKNYFSGDIYTTNIEGPGLYPFAFVNTNGGYYTNVDYCPVGNYYALDITYAEPIYRSTPYGYFYESDNSIQTMTFINMLSNSMIGYTDPRDAFKIQGGVNAYGYLWFPGPTAGLILILTLITVMLMNGIFPMAVWRLAYERSANLRLMMNTVGLKPTSYVLGMYLFDFFTMSLVNTIAMILFVETKLSSFGGAPLGYLVAVGIMSAHALSALALFLVRIAPKGSRLITLACTMGSLVLSVVAVLLGVLMYWDDGAWPNGLSIIPFFAQARAIQSLLAHHRCTEEVSIAIGLLFLSGCVCLIFELLMDWEVMTLGGITHCLRATNPTQKISTPVEPESNGDIELHNTDPNRSDQDDVDVLVERNLASQYIPNNGQYGHCAVVINKLTQTFNVSGKPLTAVNNLSLVLYYGEVFTLLGPNGAGKSTTLSIISGVFEPTLGDVYVAGVNIREDIAGVASKIGVCPQFDVVWQQLTVEEHLYFQARQRGVSDMRLNAEVQRIAIQVGLDGDAFKSAAGTLSGGQRRRLSIAMSIVGDPPIIFLDEPSSGLDPGTRKELWNLINSLKRPDRLILLTTHSMEEAETLSSRIGIISSGALRCIGTTVHLKNKFSLGYTVEINRVPTDHPIVQNLGNVDDVQEFSSVDRELDEFIENNIALGQGSSLLTAINNTRRYTIPKKNIKISKIFSEMEENKKRLNIREWGMSETSLEDIFIAIVSKK